MAEVDALAKKLAAHPKFEWLAGMKARRDTETAFWDIVRCESLDDGPAWHPCLEDDPDEWYPDLLDHWGTTGALLGLLSEATDETWTLTCHPKGWLVTGCRVRVTLGALHQTAGAALATALLDAWSSE